MRLTRLQFFYCAASKLVGGSAAIVPKDFWRFRRREINFDNCLDFRYSFHALVSIHAEKVAPIMRVCMGLVLFRSGWPTAWSFLRPRAICLSSRTGGFHYFRRAAWGACWWR